MVPSTPPAITTNTRNCRPAMYRKYLSARRLGRGALQGVSLAVDEGDDEKADDKLTPRRLRCDSTSEKSFPARSHLPAANRLLTSSMTP